jgi:nucleoside-diphosphate kinase
MTQQETLVLIKPDGVEQNIIGAIIERFESSGLRITELKMMHATDNTADMHYPVTKEWAENLALKTRSSYEKRGLKAPEITEDAMAYGKHIQSWLKQFLLSGRIVALVVKGNDAIEKVRELVGGTEPKSAAKGTIRGDFGNDSYQKADAEQRVIRNLVHASDSEETAEREIQLWFPKRND